MKTAKKENRFGVIRLREGLCMGYYANHGEMNEKENGNEVKTGSIRGMMMA